MISLQIGFPETEPADGATLRFGMATLLGVSKVVSGARAVEQHFAKLLLTKLGSDVFNVNAGSALEEIARQPVHEDNLLTIKNDLNLAILEVQNQILDSQVDLELDDSEILLTVDVDDISFSEEDGAWSLVIQLNMADGNEAQVVLEA